MILYSLPEPDIRDAFTPDQMRESLLLALRQHLISLEAPASRLLTDPASLDAVPAFARHALVRQLAKLVELTGLLVRYHDLGGQP